MSLREIIVQLLTAFIGAGGAILVYYLESKREKVKDKYIQNTLVNDKLQYLKYLLEDSLTSVNTIDKYIMDGVGEWYKNKIVYPIFIIPSSKSIYRAVSKVNQEEYFLAFKNKIKRDDIKIAFNALDEINEEIDNLNKKIENYSAISIKYKVKYNVYIDRIIKLLEDFIETNNDQSIYLIDMKHVYMNFAQYISDNKIEIKADNYMIINQNLINPLLEILNNYKKTNFLNQLLFNCKESINCIDRVLSIHSFNIASIVESRSNIVMYKTPLKINIRLLELYENKRN